MPGIKGAISLGERRPGYLALLAIVFATVLFYRRFLFEGLVPGSYDFQNYAFAHLAHLFAALGEGRLPLWDPYRLLGVPFLANPQTAVFYPVNLALAWAQPIYALTAGVVISSLVAGLGMLVFVRIGLRTGWIGALVAALAFTFGGYLATRVGLPNQLAVICWLPWIMLCVDRLLARPTLLLGAVLAVLLALQYLAGHFQAQYIALAMVGLYLLARIFRISAVSGSEALPGLLRSLLTLAGAVALSIGLAAVQLLPTLTLRSLSLRQDGLPIWHQNAFALPKEAIGSALLPSFTERGPSEEYLAYVGVVAIWLAGLALLSKARRFEAFTFLGLAILGIWISLGLATPLFSVLSDNLPGFNQFRVPARWLLLPTFALAALAGMGADHASRLTRAEWFSTAGRSMALTGAAGVVLALTSWGLGWVSALQLTAWLTAAAAAFLLLSYVAPGRTRWRILLPGFLFIELLLAQHALDMNVLASPAEAYLEPGPVVARLASGPAAPRVLSVVDTFYHLHRERIFLEVQQPFGHYGRSVLDAHQSAIKYRDSLSPNQSSALRIPSPDGYDGGLLPLKGYVAFRDRLLPARPGSEDARLQHEFVIREQFPDVDLLRAFGTSIVIADDWSDLQSASGLRINNDTTTHLPTGGRLVLNLDPPVATDAVALALTSSSPGPVVNLTATLPDGTAVALGHRPAGDGEIQEIRLSAPVTIRVLRIDAHAPVDLMAVTLIAGDRLQAIPLAGIIADPSGQAYGPAFDLEEIGSVRIYRLREPANLVELREGSNGTVRTDNIAITSARPERVEITVDAAAAGRLVLRQSYYPNWEARIDGVATSVQIADELYLAVPVPAGSNRIVFEYREPGLSTGVLISTLAAAALVAMAATGWVQSRSRPR